MTNSELIILQIFILRFSVLFVYISYKITGDTLHRNNFRTNRQQFSKYSTRSCKLSLWDVKVLYLPVNLALTASHLFPTPYQHLLSWYLPPKKKIRNETSVRQKRTLFWPKLKFDSLKSRRTVSMDVLNGACLTFKASSKTKSGKIQSIKITSSTWACVCCNLLFDLK